MQRDDTIRALHINLDIVWDTVLEDLPPLVADIEKIIPCDELP